MKLRRTVWLLLGVIRPFGYGPVADMFWGLIDWLRIGLAMFGAPLAVVFVSSTVILSAVIGWDGFDGMSLVTQMYIRSPTTTEVGDGLTTWNVCATQYD